MKNKQLVFGGSGFIGTHLVDSLIETGGNPVVYDIVKPKKDGVSYKNIDVREVIQIDEEFSETDVIYNFAAVHKTPGHPNNEYFETNILGAEQVCDFARKNNINTIVFTSSIAVYGTYEERKSETTIPMPDIPYGISKLSAEYIHKLWQLEDPINRRLIILRPGIVFGSYEGGNFTRLVNSMSKNKFVYVGRKDVKKACIYVKDLVSAVCRMVEKEKEGVNTFNFTYSSSSLRIDDICKSISEVANIRKPKLMLPKRFVFLVGNILYYLFNKKDYHPNRIKKLVISNDIDGSKLEKEYPYEYGFKKGVIDWVFETGFNEKKEIY